MRRYLFEMRFAEERISLELLEKKGNFWANMNPYYIITFVNLCLLV